LRPFTSPLVGEVAPKGRVRGIFYLIKIIFYYFVYNNFKAFFITILVRILVSNPLSQTKQRLLSKGFFNAEELVIFCKTV